MNRHGLTLLETMVALVILGMVAVGSLEVFAATSRLTNTVETWSQAVMYAEQGVELAKFDLTSALSRGREVLEPGFERVITSRSVDVGLHLVTVTVLFSNEAQFSLYRLAEHP